MAIHLLTTYHLPPTTYHLPLTTYSLTTYSLLSKAVSWATVA